MKRVSKDCKEMLSYWFRNMEEGDCVRVCGGEVVITNWSGCEIGREHI